MLISAIDYLDEVKYELLEQFNWLYSVNYSTYLSNSKSSFISGYEHCIAYANTIDINEVRKNISRGLFAIAIITTTGVGLGIPSLLIPVMAANLAKIYVISHALDYIGVLLADRARALAQQGKEEDKTRIEYLEIFSGISYALSNTVMLAGMSSIIAAPLTGAISAVHLKLASEVIIPIANALVKTISFEATKWKSNYIGSAVPQVDNTDFLLKALIVGVGYKMITGLAGDSKLIAALAYVSVRSFANAFIEADKDIYQVPHKMWKNLNSSVGLTVEFFAFDLSDRLSKSIFSSSTSLATLMFKSLNMQIIDKQLVKPVKAYFTGIDETVADVFSNIYKHANMAKERLIGQTKTNENIVPSK